MLEQINLNYLIDSKQFEKYLDNIENGAELELNSFEKKIVNAMKNICYRLFPEGDISFYELYKQLHNYYKNNIGSIIDDNYSDNITKMKKTFVKIYSHYNYGSKI